jgi:predicted RNase H-like HicB family nuclease
MPLATEENMTRTYTAYVELDEESGLYVGTIPGLPGAHSQGATLDELQSNLREVIELVLEELSAKGEPFDPPPFVGIQQIAVNS